MLFQPSQVTPSTLTNTGTVASNTYFSFSWQLNGNSPLVAYSFEIYNGSTSALVYSSGKQTLSRHQYPTDEKGNPQFLTTTAMSASTLPQNTELFLYITQYYTEGGVENQLVQTVPAVFSVATAPTVQIVDSDGAEMGTATKYYNRLFESFTASVTSDSPVERAKWKLTRVPMIAEEGTFEQYTYDDTGFVYTGVLYYQTPFLLKGTYFLELTVVCANGLSATEEAYFNINYYVLSDVANIIEVEPYDHIANKVTASLSTRIAYPGVRDGRSTFSDAALVLEENATITYTSMTYLERETSLNIPAPYTLIWTGTVYYTESDTPFLLTNQFEVSLVAAGFRVYDIEKDLTYKINFTQRLTAAFAGSFVISWSSSGIIFYTTDTVEATTVYYEIDDYALKNLTKIQLKGNNNTSGTRLSTKKIAVKMASAADDTSLTGSYIFLADMSTGSFDGTFTIPTTIETYLLRNEVNSLTADRVVLLTESRNTVIDYSWKSKTEYQYLAAVVVPANNAVVYAVEGKTWCLRTGTYALLECAESSQYSKMYKVIRSWQFGCNVSSSEITNNNTPSMLTNFTKYRMPQRTAWQGRSGTLSGLLGAVQNGEYVSDTAQLMDELYAISASNNRFFLKDTKGNFYAVCVSAPVRQSTNLNSLPQQTTVSIGWEEIDDASGLVVREDNLFL